jgi:DNA polymerase-3 subunit epsilon
MNEVFLDTETTGLSFRENHKLVEIACIETKDLIPTKLVFHKLLNPERDVPDEAYQIHGFSSEILSKQETFKKVADEFLDFIKEKRLIIHNASFDIGFLNHELRLLKKNEIKNDQVIDTLKLAREKFPGTSNSLDALCRRFNISLLERKKHNALLDCQLLREVYINLLDIKEPKLIFSSEKSDNNLKSNFKNTNRYSKKIIELSKKELENHQNFLYKEIKKNYF